MSYENSSVITKDGRKKKLPSFKTNTSSIYSKVPTLGHKML